MTMQPIGSPGVRPNTLHDQTAPNTLHGLGSAGTRPVERKPRDRQATAGQPWPGTHREGGAARRTSRSRSAAAPGRARLVIPSWVYMAALALMLFFFYLLQGAPTS